MIKPGVKSGAEMEGVNMFRKMAAILLAAVTLAGCGNSEIGPNVQESRFITVETTNTWWVVADKKEGVMYAVSHDTHNNGTFTLLVDKDGKPLIWEGCGQD